jgi:hypothetical protein
VKCKGEAWVARLARKSRERFGCWTSRILGLLTASPLIRISQLDVETRHFSGMNRPIFCFILGEENLICHKVSDTDRKVRVQVADQNRTARVFLSALELK